MTRKSVLSFKAVDPAGSAGLAMVRARVADLRPGVVDRDGDVYTPGAFSAVEGNSDVIFGAYQHRSYEGELPVGRGAVVETADGFAEFVGVVDTSSERGRNYVSLLKLLGDRQEWSFGYRVLDWHPSTVDGRPVRVLDRVAVDEVSPVLGAAGVGTQTLSVGDEDVTKTEAFREYLRYIRNLTGVR